jgi:hypothetical protein
LSHGSHAPCGSAAFARTSFSPIATMLSAARCRVRLRPFAPFGRHLGEDGRAVGPHPVQCLQHCCQQRLGRSGVVAVRRQLVDQCPLPGDAVLGIRDVLVGQQQVLLVHGHHGCLPVSAITDLVRP